MSRLLLYSVPLAAAGVSCWRWLLQTPRPPELCPDHPEPVFIPSRFPPLEAADTAISRPPSVLQVAGRPLARLRLGDACQRREAAAALARLRGLTAADCRQLAQTLDADCALLLALWSSTDLRLFLPPPAAAGAGSEPLEPRLRRLLERLPAGGPCAEFWRRRALRQPWPADWEPPLSAEPAEPPPWRAAPALAVETACLRALLARAPSRRQRPALLEAGLLDLLAAAHAQRPRDAARCGLIAQILAWVGSAAQLHQAGWLGLLAAWSREQDVRVGPPAWRVLRNLCLTEGLLRTDTATAAAGSRHHGTGQTHTDSTDTRPSAEPDTRPSAEHDTRPSAEHDTRPSAEHTSEADGEDVVASALVSLDSHWAVLRSRLLSAVSSVGLSESRPEPRRRSRRELRPLPAGVLVLHPRNLLAEADTEVDVVFVHGLLGATERTWRQSDAARPSLPPPPEPSLSEIVLRRAGETQETTQSDSVVNKNGGGNNISNPTTGENVPSTNNPIHATTSDTITCPTPAERYTQCWPRDWLPADLHPLRVRVLSVDYDSAWSEWRPRCPSPSAGLSSRAAELKRVLTEAGVGDRPVVWVAHSMGGLLVKQLLVDVDQGGGDARGESGDVCRGRTDREISGGNIAKVVDGDISGTGAGAGVNHVSLDDISGVCSGKSADSEHQLSDKPRHQNATLRHPSPLSPLLSSTLGVLFLSCPHSGSDLASVLPAPLRPLLLPSPELDSLRRDSAGLVQLRHSFIALCRRRRVACLSVAETRPMTLLGRQVMFVDEKSADAGVGRVVTVGEDHLGVCKPRDRQSEMYRLLLGFLRELCSAL